MKKLAIVALLAVLAAPSWAAVSTINNGDGTSSLRLQYTVATANVVDVRDDICRGIGWTSTLTCNATLVQAGTCTSGQLGQQVANPQTCPQAIDAHVSVYLRSLRKTGEDIEARATIAASLAANHDADIAP